MKRFLWLPVLCVAATFVSQAGAGEKKGEVVELGGLKSAAPANWKAAPTPSKLRIYEFKVPKTDGDAKDGEVAIFFFGKGSGGSVEDNLSRWKKMFRAPEGKTIDDVAKVEKIKVGDASITYLDVSGTYLAKFPPFDPNAKEVPHTNYRMLSIVFECDNGPYFIRFTGPAKTVEQQKKGFDQWLKNFK